MEVRNRYGNLQLLITINNFRGVLPWKGYPVKYGDMLRVDTAIPKHEPRKKRNELKFKNCLFMSSFKVYLFTYDNEF